MSRIVVCALCGEEFNTNKPRIKYCDNCKDIAKYQVRKEWEKKTRHGEKQRDLLREKRAKAAEEHLKQQEEESLLRAEEERKLQEEKDIENEKELQERAKEGDFFANMEIAFREGGLYNTDYWYWFKAYEIDYAESMGKKSRRIVNGISVYEPEFEKLVVASIETTGRIVREMF